jgi:hypothetical protein
MRLRQLLSGSDQLRFVLHLRVRTQNAKSLPQRFALEPQNEKLRLAVQSILFRASRHNDTSTTRGINIEINVAVGSDAFVNTIHQQVATRFI